jgi:biotin transporter BioY
MLTMKKHEYVAIEDDQNTVHDEITYSIAEKSWKRRFYMLLSLTVLITVVTSALVVWFSLSMTCSVRRSNVNIPYSKLFKVFTLPFFTLTDN